MNVSQTINQINIQTHIITSQLLKRAMDEGNVEIYKDLLADAQDIKLHVGAFLSKGKELTYDEWFETFKYCNLDNRTRKHSAELATLMDEVVSLDCQDYFYTEVLPDMDEGTLLDFNNEIDRLIAVYKEMIADMENA